MLIYLHVRHPWMNRIDTHDMCLHCVAFHDWTKPATTVKRNDSHLDL